MIHRVPLALLAMLCASPLAAAQSSKIIIGDGTASSADAAFEFNDHQGFAAAITAIQTSGQAGTIEVLPGVYTFDEQVLVDTPGVRITGGPNAIIKPSTSLVTGGGAGLACFKTDGAGSDFVIDGVTFLDDRSSPPVGPVFVEVTTPRFSLLNCRVQVANENAATASTAFALIPQPAGSLNFGHLFQGNVFLVGRYDEQEEANVDAEGRTLIHSRGGRNLRVVGNSFHSGFVEEDLAPAKLSCAIRLEKEELVALTGNTFSYLETPTGSETDPTRDSLVIHTSAVGTDVGGESNHIAISGNYFEACTVVSAVCLRGHGHSAITGNVFGRVDAGEWGVVCLLAEDGTAGTIGDFGNVGNSGTVVDGNNFHNSGHEDNPSIHVRGGAHLTLTDNVFDSDGRHHVLVESVDGLVVEGNQFLGPSSTGDCPLYLLRLDTVKGASIVGNRFKSVCTSTTEAPIDLTTSGSSIAAFICGNRFDVGGSTNPKWSLNNYTVDDCRVANGNPAY